MAQQLPLREPLWLSVSPLHEHWFWTHTWLSAASACPTPLLVAPHINPDVTDEYFRLVKIMLIYQIVYILTNTIKS